MITRIRDVRRAKRMTLEAVARRCSPPTTAQTIGRLETGARTVSIGWLDRIADALGVEASDLIDLPDREQIEVAAVLNQDGVRAPNRPGCVVPPKPGDDQLAIAVESSLGEYRAGDEIWCRKLDPPAYAGALNRDVLLPRAAGRLAFGRLIGSEGGTLHLLPLDAGGRQIVVADPPWAAVAVRLIRNF
jgi:transcriptional regulator with XRE-family HTH domain